MGNSSKYCSLSTDQGVFNYSEACYKYLSQLELEIFKKVVGQEGLDRYFCLG